MTLYNNTNRQTFKINMSESQNIEYKQNWRDEYQKWICGFANAQGGTIFVGIDDEGEVCGVEYPERATIQERTETIQKTIQKQLSRQQEAILAYLSKHPDATRKELCENITDVTMGGIIHNLSRLQELGLLKRVGGRKQGYWQIVEP